MTELVTFSTVAEPTLDVVFVHGLGGDPTRTWTSASGAGHWPTWVSESNPTVRVCAVSYPFSFTLFSSNSLTLRDRAKTLLELLRVNHFGERPIVFVTHSLGGVVAKEAIRQSSTSGSSDYKALALSTAAVVFLATPTRTESLRKLNWLVWPLKGLIRPDDDALVAELNTWYRHWAPENKVTTLSFASVSDRIAPEVDPGVRDAVVIPIDANHTEIAKPKSPHALQVASVQRLITDLLHLGSRPNQRGQIT